MTQSVGSLIQPTPAQPKAAQPPTGETWPRQSGLDRFMCELIDVLPDAPERTPYTPQPKKKADPLKALETSSEEDDDSQGGLFGVQPAKVFGLLALAAVAYSVIGRGGVKLPSLPNAAAPSAAAPQPSAPVTPLERHMATLNPKEYIR